MQEKLENSLNKFSSTCFLKTTQINISSFGISDDKYISICKSKYFHEIVDFISQSLFAHYR